MPKAAELARAAESPTWHAASVRFDLSSALSALRCLRGTWSLPSTGSAMRGTRGLPSPGVNAMEVFGAQGSLDDLIADVEDGVLVFSMKGLHSGVNAVSGDFSVGLDGLRIRNGVVSEPISECTAASTLQRILLNIRALGSDSTALPSGVIVPSMVVDDVMLSGDN